MKIKNKSFNLLVLVVVDAVVSVPVKTDTAIPAAAPPPIKSKADNTLKKMTIFFLDVTAFLKGTSFICFGLTLLF